MFKFWIKTITWWHIVQNLDKWVLNQHQIIKTCRMLREKEVINPNEFYLILNSHGRRLCISPWLCDISEAYSLMPLLFSISYTWGFACLKQAYMHHDEGWRCINTNINLFPAIYSHINHLVRVSPLCIISWYNFYYHELPKMKLKSNGWHF